MRRPWLSYVGLIDSCDVWMSFVSTPCCFTVSISELALALFCASASLALADCVSTPSTTRKVSGVPFTSPTPRAAIVGRPLSVETFAAGAAPAGFVPSLAHPASARPATAATAACPPARLAGAGLRLTGELASAAAGAAKREPERGDRRFADPAWAENPIYRRVLQGYLGTAAVASETVGRLGLDPKSEERGRFVVGQVVDALAPTNTLLGNPAALKAAVETKGASLAKGGRQLADDVLHNGAMPKTVDRRPFKLGETIATSPGAV